MKGIVSVKKKDGKLKDSHYCKRILLLESQSSKRMSHPLLQSLFQFSASLVSSLISYAVDSFLLGNIMYVWLCNILYMKCPVHSSYHSKEREVTLTIQTIWRICHKDIRIGRCSSTRS